MATQLLLQKQSMLKKQLTDASEYAHFCELAFVQTKKIWWLYEALRATHKKGKMISKQHRLAYKKRMVALARIRSINKANSNDRGYWTTTLVREAKPAPGSEVSQGLVDGYNELRSKYHLPNVSTCYIPLLIRFIVEYCTLRLTLGQKSDASHLAKQIL